MNESPNPQPSGVGIKDSSSVLSGSSLLRKPQKGSLGVARDSCLDPAEGAGGSAAPWKAWKGRRRNWGGGEKEK